jgi:virginiamycin B lyase
MMRVSFRSAALATIAPALLFAPDAQAQQGDKVPAAEWEVPYGGRPRDPYVHPDGSVFFVGQAGNYIGRLDPRSGAFKQFEIDPGTNPHNLIIDKDGMVWYAGNRNGMIGKLDPRDGKIARYPMPDSTVRDPHTLTFDQQGNIWFTAQNSNAIGHLDVKSGKIRLVKTGDRTRPYGIEINSKGIPWVNLFGTNKIAKVDPATMAVTTYDLPHERARSRRIAITPDDVVWYVDYTRGFLGRVDPANGKVTEVPMPGGPASLPYGMGKDEKGRLWVTESGRDGAILYGYDPKTAKFFGKTLIGKEDNNTIRHMYFDPKTGMLWFGTDQGTIGRAEVSGARITM